MSKTDFQKYPTLMLGHFFRDIFNNVGTYIPKMSKTGFWKYPTMMLDEKNWTFLAM
jgi:hypothetical protein